MVRPKELNKGDIMINGEDPANWEEVPAEDLWQDGEIKDIIYHQVIKQGVWKIIRRKHG